MRKRYCFCSAGIALPIVGHGQGADSKKSFGPIGFGDSEVEGQGVKGDGAVICSGNYDVFVIAVVDTLGSRYPVAVSTRSSFSLVARNKKRRLINEARLLSIRCQ